MQLKPVKELPAKKANCQYKNLREYLSSFMRMNVKCARVEYAGHEFSNVYSAMGSFRRIIKLFNYPVEASIINSELYLIRTDMED